MCGRGHRLVVVATLAVLPTACDAFFSLDGLTGGDGGPGGDAAGFETSVDSAPPGDGAMRGDSSAGADGEGGGQPEAGGPDAGTDATPTQDVVVLDAPQEVASEAGVTYAQEVMMDSPSAYWRMGESAGATVVDASGNGVNGTYVGGVTHGVPGAIVGDSDTATTFDGQAGTAADMGDVFQFPGTQALSLECWVKPVPSADYHGFMSRNDPGSGPVEGYLLYMEPNPAPLIAFQRVDAGTKYSAESTSSLSSGVWAHVVLTYDGANALVYVDGQLQSTTPMPTAIGGATNHFVLAAEAGGTTSNLNGALDEVAVYATALPAKRVLAHYDVGMGLPPPP